MNNILEKLDRFADSFIQVRGTLEALGLTELQIRQVFSHLSGATGGPNIFEIIEGVSVYVKRQKELEEENATLKFCVKRYANKKNWARTCEKGPDVVYMGTAPGYSTAQTCLDYLEELKDEALR